MKVFHPDFVDEYLRKRQIFEQFQKAALYIECGYPEKTNLKLLNPKKLKIYQFRITKKYRALAYK